MIAQETPALSMPKIRRRVNHSNVWLLSFGDLVTLLLGFFVAIIAYALQAPPPVPVQLKTTTAGTTIAEVKGEDGRVAIRRIITVPAEGFEPGSGAMAEAGRNILRKQLNSEEFRTAQIAIHGCIGEAAGDREQARFTMMGRVLATASQVLDAGVAETRVQVESPGAYCEAGMEPGAVVVTAE